MDGLSGEDFGWRDDFIANYLPGKLVGQGSFGTVYMGVDLHTGKEVAIKVMPKVRGKLTKEKTLEKLAREVDILERLQEVPGVITLEDVFEDAQNVLLVTELCTGGDLQKFVEEHGPLSERNLAVVAYEVLKMVKACHEAGLLHGDVKPANFVLKHKTRHPLTGGIGAPSSTWLKGIDFGCSQLLPATRRLSKRTGTPVYMAPEIYQREYHVEADMWSIGVMLYQLFTRRFPFWENVETCKASKLEDVALAVSEADISYNYGPWLTMSKEGKDFIDRCLQRDVSDRMTVEEALEHPWIKKHVLGDAGSSSIHGKAAHSASTSGRVLQMHDAPAAAA